MPIKGCVQALGSAVPGTRMPPEHVGRSLEGCRAWWEQPALTIHSVARRWRSAARPRPQVPAEAEAGAGAPRQQRM